MDDNLCPIHHHPELAGMDDSEIQQFANVLKVELSRNWDGRPATSIEDAWRIRAHLDAERLRTAENDNARHEQLAAETTSRLAPIAHRLEHQQRRAEILAQLDTSDPITDQRFREWEREASEKGDALFEKVDPPTPIDTRTPLQRLKDKEPAR